MQLQSKFTKSQYKWLTNKRMVVIVLIIFWLGVAIFFQVRKSQNPKSNPGEQGKYYDTRSGETISNPPGKTPESYGSISNEVIYLGFSKLTTYGVTQAQLSATKDGLVRYGKSTNQSIKEVSLDVKSISLLDVDPNDAEGKQALGFSLQFDRKNILNSRLEYYRASLVHLYLLDDKGKIVFDSGTIDGSLPPGE